MLFRTICLSAREWPQTWQCGASRQGLRRRCFDRAMNASCGKTSPANSVRQGGRGGRARRQSRWPGARFCGRSASGAGMAAVPASRQGLHRRCFDRAMSASCGKTSPANSVRQGGRGGRARRQSRWPGGGAFLCRLPFGAGMAAVPATRQGLRRLFALAIGASRRKFSVLNAAASIRSGRHEAQCGFFAMRAALGLIFLWKDAWPFACAIAGLARNLFCGDKDRRAER